MWSKNVFFQKWSKKCKKSKRWDFQKYIEISPKKFEGCRVKIMTCVFFWLQDDCRRQNSFLYSVIWKEPFLRYIFNFFVHFQQSFDFYASYEPDFFTDTNYYVKRSSQIPWTCSHSPLKMFKKHLKESSNSKHERLSEYFNIANFIRLLQIENLYDESGIDEISRFCVISSSGDVCHYSNTDKDGKIILPSTDTVENLKQKLCT